MAKKKKVKKEKVVQEREVKKPQKTLEINSDQDISEQINQYLESTEPDNIQGIYGTPEHSTGCTNVLYSGLPSLDKIIGVKRDTKIYGLPLNKMIEIFGPEGSMKTTIAKYFAAVFLKNKGIVHFVDFEDKFDPAWMRTIAYKNGLNEEDLKRMRLVRPKHFEWFIDWLLKHMHTIIKLKDQAREDLCDLEKRKNKPANYDELILKYRKIIDIPSLVIIDSIANMFTKNEVEMEEGKGNKEDKKKDQVAELARLFSLRLKMIRRLLNRSNMLILWINQMRDVIGSRFRMMSQPGGHAIKHNVDARLKTSKEGNLRRTRKGIERSYGSEHEITCVKNQIGVIPMQSTIIKLIFDRGPFAFHSVLESCAEAGIIKKEGTTYHIKTRLSFDEDSLDEELLKNPKVEQVLHSVYQKHMEKQ